MRKIVVVPEPVSVSLLGPDGQKRDVVFLFSNFLLGRLNDVAWGRSFDLLQARADVFRAFEGKKPGSAVPIRRSDWEVLAACTRQPAQPYVPEIVGSALSFIQAIVDAKDEGVVVGSS